MQTKINPLILMVSGGLLTIGLLGGCSQSNMNEGAAATKPAKTFSEEDLGLRKETLYSEKTIAPSNTEYSTSTAGSGKKFDRAYENAPPMIPHDTEGMLPITRDMNACLSCHTKEVAPSVGATSIPPSHYMNFRTQEKLADVSQARYNCSQCHAPQSNTALTVANEFKADFRKKEASGKSNLADVLNEGVK